MANPTGYDSLQQFITQCLDGLGGGVDYGVDYGAGGVDDWGAEDDLSGLDEFQDIVVTPYAQPAPLTPMRSVDTLRSLVAAGVVSVDDLREVLTELGIASVAPEAHPVRGIRIREEVH